MCLYQDDCAAIENDQLIDEMDLPELSDIKECKQLLQQQVN
jgi:hypothetical protein